MSILITGEKPSVGKAISAVVGADKTSKTHNEGNGYIVSWCYGHLAGLKTPDEYSEKWSGRWDFSQLPMIPDKWGLKVSEETKAQFNVLAKFMNSPDVTEIICATDADREGECIFRYIYELTGCRKPVKRLWVSSLEESALKKAFSDMKSMAEYDNLYHAGFSRARADWLVGMNGSRLFSCRYNQGLNVGRVQTPTLAMIVKRDDEVKNFVKQKYFTIDLDCGDFTLSSGRIYEESEADQAMKNIEGKKVNILRTEVIPSHENPPALYDLTSLQRDANRIFGYSAQQTLDFLQALYEGKLATYPRSDSRYLTEDMKQTALDVLEQVQKVYDSGTVDAPDISRSICNSKVTGHHAVIPTVNIGTANIEGLPDGEKNILALISNRLLCACAAPFEFERIKIAATCESYDFEAKTKNIIKQGWKQYVLRKSEEDEEYCVLPLIPPGEQFSFSACKSEHYTSPPKPYTEDTLLYAMEHTEKKEFMKEVEKKGIGTPATRAATIESLVKRGYAERKGKQITATEKGRNLISAVPDEVKSAQLTADWENQLLLVERGELSAESFMNGIESFVKDLCMKYGTYDSAASFGTSEPAEKCPKCGSEIKKGKYGFYCKAKCGMNLTKLYGHDLTDSQVLSLLNGKSISFTANGRKTVAEPEVVSNEYNNRINYQWKTRKG